jgi:hypothetical protein
MAQHVYVVTDENEDGLAREVCVHASLEGAKAKMIELECRIYGYGADPEIKAKIKAISLDQHRSHCIEYRRGFLVVDRMEIQP